MNKVYIGFDSTQPKAFRVAASSLSEHAQWQVPVGCIRLQAMIEAGFYNRPTETRNGQMWDVISDAPMSTEFAISRFLTPHLAKEGWALFTDCDVMFRADVRELFALADPRYAVMCVKHGEKALSDQKMSGKQQAPYARKFWSSVMLFNCDHPANHRLTVDMINTVPGRDLHRFCWLKDRDIGELGVEWNWLVGYSPPCDPKIVHFTDGTPEIIPYAEEWLAHADLRMRAVA